MAALPSPLPSSAPTPLVVRDLCPDDAPLLDALHERLSPQSRYQRFHGAKPRLSPRERTLLSSTDAHRHVALVALDAAGGPVGVARFIRFGDDPASADIATEVADPWQRQGLGSDLIGRLARRAAGAGVQRFSATVLSETGLGRALARRGWRVRSSDGPTTTLEVDVWRLVTG